MAAQDAARVKALEPPTAGLDETSACNADYTRMQRHKAIVVPGWSNAFKLPAPAVKSRKVYEAEVGDPYVGYGCVQNPNGTGSGRLYYEFASCESADSFTEAKPAPAAY
jgi:hypothetical protein